MLAMLGFAAAIGFGAIALSWAVSDESTPMDRTDLVQTDRFGFAADRD